MFFIRSVRDFGCWPDCAEMRDIDFYMYLVRYSRRPEQPEIKKASIFTRIPCGFVSNFGVGDSSFCLNLERSEEILDI